MAPFALWLMLEKSLGLLDGWKARELLILIQVDHQHVMQPSYVKGKWSDFGLKCCDSNTECCLVAAQATHHFFLLDPPSTKQKGGAFDPHTGGSSACDATVICEGKMERLWLEVLYRCIL